MANLTDKDVAELRRMRHKLDNIRGPGVTNRPDGVTIVPPIARVNPASVPKMGAGLKYQVWMTLDDNGTTGYDWCRIHA